MKKKYCRVDDEERGRHLVATERIDAGSLVFMERPLLCQQSLANSHEGALACRHCKCFIGNPTMGLQLTCGLLSRQDICNKLVANQNQQGEEEKIVPCRQFCGELYCSNSCEQIHWESSGHCLLCTGSITESDENNHKEMNESNIYNNDTYLQQQHPLIRFKVHAVQTNEIFLLVADWIGTVICRYYRRLQQYHEQQGFGDIINENENDAKENLTEKNIRKNLVSPSTFLLFGDSNNKESNDNHLSNEPLAKSTRLLLLEQILEPFTDFTMNLWWDTCSPSDQEKDAIQHLCQTSSQLLKEALMLQLEELQEDVIWRMSIKDCTDFLCSSKGFGRIIGSFEQNAIGVRARHPLCFDIFDRQLREKNHNAIVQCFAKAGFLDTNDYDDDDTMATCDHDECIISIKGGDTTSNNDDLVDGPISTEGVVDDASDSTSSINGNVDYSVNDICEILNQLYISTERKYGDEEKLDGDEEKLDGDDLDHIFAPLDGIAMFSLACKMNHSCHPNVIVRYAKVGWYRPLTLQCVAIREIQKGEELCISYIDVTADSAIMNIQDRWRQLESYGFKCNCERCRLEQQQQFNKNESLSTCTTAATCPLVAKDASTLLTDKANAIYIYGDQAKSAIGEEDEAEKILQERFVSLITANNAMLGGIPKQIYTSPTLYAISTGRSALEKIQQQERSDTIGIESLLQRTVDALECEKLILCRIHGSYGEEYLAGGRQEEWFQDAYSCFVIAACIGYAHQGAMDDVISILSKAKTLPREAVEDLWDYASCFLVAPYLSNNT